MLSLLTKYLLQYKKVVIPHIGQFELLPHPATFDFGDRLIYSPTYKTQFIPEDRVADHQINYMAIATGSDGVTISQQLNELGTSLKNTIQQQVFEWQGIGQLKWSDNGGIIFQPAAISVSGLQPVTAHKVLREKVQHTVLVGDHEVQTSVNEPATEVIDQPLKRKRTVLWIAGILTVLAIGFIVYYFYANGFQTSSSGYRQKVNAINPERTYAPNL